MYHFLKPHFSKYKITLAHFSFKLNKLFPNRHKPKLFFFLHFNTELYCDNKQHIRLCKISHELVCYWIWQHIFIWNLTMVAWAWCWDWIRSFWFGYNILHLHADKNHILGVWIKVGYACVEGSPHLHIE